MTRTTKAIIATALTGMIAVATGPATAAGTKDGLSPAQRTEIQKLIRDTLIKHPEIIVQAVQELRRRQKAAKAAALRAELKAKRKELIADPADPVVGNPRGNVTVVEFFDYNCPYCRRVKAELDSVVAKDGKIRVVYKEFPILGPGSEFAARAALASMRQGKYKKFHNAMFAYKGRLGPAQVMAIAKAVGLNIEQLKTDMKSPAITAQIKKNHALAQALRITGTPAFVIGDALVPGAVPADELTEHVTAARARCKKLDSKIC